MENLSSNAFIEKTKKQAKRLLKLAQTKQSNIEIKNLAHAQEILAQINGYPHWHALESTISKKPTLETVIAKNTQKYEMGNIIDGVNYFIKDDKLVSVFEIIDLPLSLDKFLGEIEELKEKLSLQFNMGFNEVSLVISNQYSQSSQDNYSFSLLANSLSIKESLLKKLFTLNVSIDKESKFYLSALLIIKTNCEMQEEHVGFCQNLKKGEAINLKLRDYLTSNEFSIINHSTEKLKQRVSINNEYNLCLKKIIASSKAWIHSIDLLNKKKFEWDMEIDLNNSILNFYQAKENKSHETYLGGLYKSLNINNRVHNIEMFDFNNKESNCIPWSKGIPFINNTDHNVSYYEPGSDLQTTHNTLILAQPGSGSSLLMNTMNLYAIDNQQLPYIGIIDIGPSAKAFIDLVKQIVPLKEKNLIQYHKIKMTKEYCVNPFDTQLGCRFPTAEEKALLNNFLLLLVTDENKKNPEDSMTGLVLAIIEHMYIQTSEKGNPKKYFKGVNVIVDEALKKTGLSVDERTTWWEVVDNLFNHDFIDEAMLAQRNAVPLLADASSSAQDEKIRDVYSKVTVSTGGDLIEYFNRCVTDALNRYEILGQPTVFDISKAQIVNLDLEHVKPGVQAERQTAVMYMVACGLINKKYKQNYSTIEDAIYTSPIPNYIPYKKYKIYHEERIKKNYQRKNIIWFNELHRVGRSKIVRNQIFVEMRESRKWNAQINVITQNVSDVKDTIIDMCTSFFVLGNSYTKHELEEFINNSEEKMFSLVKGPRSNKPGVMFAKFITKNGSVSKLLSLQPNRYLITSLSTTVEDLKIKEKLLTVFDIEKTLDILTEEYPMGIKSEVENTDPDKAINIIFDKLVNKYKND